MSALWHKSSLQGLPGSPLFRGDERVSPYNGDVAVHAVPDAVVRARDPQEVSEVLAYCHGHRIPVTFSGGRTGLTGASATDEGLLIATETRSRILDIGKSDTGQLYAVAEPGILLGELKQAVTAEGFFYPPDPTSYQEACLGGTVATNATGEDTLLYGPTRKYIQALTVIKTDGSIQKLQRPPSDQAPETKGTAGYIRFDPLIDLLVGSEGTLAYISEITVDLLPDPDPCWAGMAFFPDLSSALNFATAALQSTRVTPRALEFMDGPSLAILKEDPEIPTIPESAQGAIYWKQEFRDDAELEISLGNWLEILNRVLRQSSHPQLSDQVWVAQSKKELERFRAWRHQVPCQINERVAKFNSQGGGKIASDWWVPVSKINEALNKALQESEATGLETLTFGHVGNGHLHINYIARNADEHRLAQELIRRQCQRAVKWGGGVAGEHGIGKKYREHLDIQHPSTVIKKMLKIKREWDPQWILGRGTLFQAP